MMQMRLVKSYPVIYLTGPMVYDIVEELKENLLQFLDQNYQAVIIDCSGVEFITSAGLGVLYTAKKEFQMRERTLILIVDNDAVLHSLHDLGLERIIPIFSTVSEAITHLQSNPVKN